MKTTDASIMPFSPSERVGLEANFGRDAEYYEQAGQTFAIEFTEIDPGSYLHEAFAIERLPNGELRNSKKPDNEFDWESAEAFRGAKFE